MRILEDFKIKTTIEMAWGEMDILGHINSSVYFKYFETGRILYYESVGLGTYFSDNNIYGVVASTECNYILPLKYPGTIIIGARVSEIDKDKMIMEYYISYNNCLFATGEATINLINLANGKKIPFPENIIKNIKLYENLKI